ncbi:MAG TPA: hypothetical protein VLS49_02295 [Usitatibacter sp.]|nr:hypothetical protein [Usitatibacter sp.]
MNKLSALLATLLASASLAVFAADNGAKPATQAEPAKAMATTTAEPAKTDEAKPAKHKKITKKHTVKKSTKKLAKAQKPAEKPAEPKVEEPKK